MAAQHIGQCVSKHMTLFEEARARLVAPQSIAREQFGRRSHFSLAPLPTARRSQCPITHSNQTHIHQET